MVKPSNDILLEAFSAEPTLRQMAEGTTFVRPVPASCPAECSTGNRLYH